MKRLQLPDGWHWGDRYWWITKHGHIRRRQLIEPTKAQTRRLMIHRLEARLATGNVYRSQPAAQQAHDWPNGNAPPVDPLHMTASELLDKIARDVALLRRDMPGFRIVLRLKEKYAPPQT